MWCWMCGYRVCWWTMQVILMLLCYKSFVICRKYIYIYLFLAWDTWPWRRYKKPQTAYNVHKKNTHSPHIDTTLPTLLIFRYILFFSVSFVLSSLDSHNIPLLPQLFSSISFPTPSLARTIPFDSQRIRYICWSRAGTVPKHVCHVHSSLSISCNIESS